MYHKVQVRCTETVNVEFNSVDVELKSVFPKRMGLQILRLNKITNSASKHPMNAAGGRVSPPEVVPVEF